jgi:hypothetical protein
MSWAAHAAAHQRKARRYEIGDLRGDVWSGFTALYTSATLAQAIAWQRLWQKLLAGSSATSMAATSGAN